MGDEGVVEVRKNRGFLGFDSTALPPRDLQARLQPVCTKSVLAMEEEEEETRTTADCDSPSTIGPAPATLRTGSQ